jgi:hypothetical protein
MYGNEQSAKAWSTVSSQPWLSETWGRLHGAPVVWIQSVKLDTVDQLRLSKYMATQYMAHGQGDALERFFQSRQRAWEGVNVPRIRKALWFLIGYQWVVDYPPDASPQEQAVQFQARRVKRVKLFRELWRLCLKKYVSL